MTMKLETKVGAFFIASIGVLGLLILRMEKLELFSGNNQNHLSTEFDQVAGLNPQSKVRVAGVAVGTVSGIELDGKKAKVILSLPKEFPVYQDAVASLSSIGILGEKYIELDPGHPQAGRIRPDAMIPSKAGMSMDSLMESLGGISKDVKSITSALNASMGGEQGRQKLDEIIDNIRQLTGEFRAMAQENHGAVNATMANVQQMSSELKDRLPRLAQQFEDLGRNLNALVGDNRPEFKNILDNMNKLTAGPAGHRQERQRHHRQDRPRRRHHRRPHQRRHHRQEGQPGRGQRELHAGRLPLHGPEPGHERGPLDQPGRFQGGHQHRPRPRPRPLVHHGAQFHPRRQDHLELAHRHPTTPTGAQTGSYSSVNVDQTFTVSAQFAKRIYENFVFTAGFVESKGGVGRPVPGQRGPVPRRGPRLRFHQASGQAQSPLPPDHQLPVLQELLRHGRRSRTSPTPPLRTFFFGGGLRWKDDDLKKLVGLASVGK